MSVDHVLEKEVFLDFLAELGLLLADCLLEPLELCSLAWVRLRRLLTWLRLLLLELHLQLAVSVEQHVYLVIG